MRTAEIAGMPLPVGREGERQRGLKQINASEADVRARNGGNPVSFFLSWQNPHFRAGRPVTFM